MKNSMIGVSKMPITHFQDSFFHNLSYSVLQRNGIFFEFGRIFSEKFFYNLLNSLK